MVTSLTQVDYSTAAKMFFMCLFASYARAYASMSILFVKESNTA